MASQVLTSSPPEPLAVGSPLPEALQRKLHELMLTTRVLEERLIKMYKQGDGYFWIGGPGEEAFNIPLGLLARKGQGLDHERRVWHVTGDARGEAISDATDRVATCRGELRGR